ncbi:MAG: hypothetical protein AB8H86_07685 [Polyangiales bacterium]
MSALLFRLSVVTFLLSASAAPSFAQCDEDDFAVVESAPASGATDVPTNAFIRVVYPRCYFSLTGQDPLTSLEVTLDGAPVEGTLQQGDDQTVFFVPQGLLDNARRYEVIARDFEGDFAFSFTTGFNVDTSPPEFPEPQLTVTSSRIPEESADLPEGGYRVDVSFDPAVDDGAAASIEYLLYLTRGNEELDAPQLRARARNFTTGLITMAFVITDEEAAQPLCVEVHAIDGVGRMSVDRPSQCFEPIMGSFFEGCSVSAPGGADGGMAWLVGVCVWLAGRRRTRRRSSRSR